MCWAAWSSHDILIAAVVGQVECDVDELPGGVVALQGAGGAQLTDVAFAPGGDILAAVTADGQVRWTVHGSGAGGAALLASATTACGMSLEPLHDNDHVKSCSGFRASD